MIVSIVQQRGVVDEKRPLNSVCPIQSPTGLRKSQNFPGAGTENESEMTYSGGQPVDRRASTRRDVRVPININPPNILPMISGRIQDMSLGGMKVKTEITPMPFQIRDEVMFLVSRDYFKFQGQGEILWTSPTGGTIGNKFTRLDEEARKSLDEFLSLFVYVPTSNR